VCVRVLCGVGVGVPFCGCGCGIGVWCVLVSPGVVVLVVVVVVLVLVSPGVVCGAVASAASTRRLFLAIFAVAAVVVVKGSVCLSALCVAHW
jgi:hypothetical protein